MNKILLKKVKNILTILFILNCSVIFSQEIDVSISGVNIVDGSTVPNLTNQTDFGTTNETSGTITKTFVINNSGLSNLTLGTFTIGGTNSGDFVVTKTYTSPVTPLGGKTTFEVTFNPSALGLRTATISFVNNDASENPFNFNIQGTGTSFATQSKTIYYENFDNNDGLWTSSNTSGTGTWVYGNSIHRGEGNFWRVSTDGSGRYTANNLTYLTSPTINTSGYKNIKLFIDTRYKTDADLNDGMQIQYSIDNGTSWNVLNNNSVSSAWYSASNVTALSGSLSSTNGWNDDGSKNPNSPFAPAASPFSQFTEKSVQNNILDNIGTLKFRAVFASNGSNSDTGVAIDNIMIKGDPIIAEADPVIGPGSINSSLKLWLKSNTGTGATTDGNALATWGDQAFDNHATGITGNNPIYRNNATRNVNFNPAIDFTAASSHVMKGKGGYWSQDYYVVVKTNGNIDNSATARQSPISGRVSIANFHVDGTAFAFGNFTARYTNEMVSHSINSITSNSPPTTNSYGMAFTSSTDSYVQQTIIFNIKTNAAGTATEIYKNGKKIDNTVGQTVLSDGSTLSGTNQNFSEFNNLQYNLGVGRFTLGGNAASSYLNGRMTEVVSYSEKKNRT